MPITSKAIKRSIGLGIIILIGFAILLIRIFFIQTVNFDEYQDKVLDQITTETPIPAKRGSIYDRNGLPIATTIQTYRVFISPSGIKSAMNDRAEGDTTDYEDLVAKGLSLCVMVISETTLLWKATEEVVMGSPLTMSHSQSSLFYTFKTHHTIL